MSGPMSPPLGGPTLHGVTRPRYTALHGVTRRHTAPGGLQRAGELAQRRPPTVLVFRNYVRTEQLPTLVEVSVARGHCVDRGCLRAAATLPFWRWLLT
eukprot:2750073-Pyramimonas_sp.AAC.2